MKSGWQTATLFSYCSLMSDGGFFSNQLFIVACLNDYFWVGFFSF